MTTPTHGGGMLGLAEHRWTAENGLELTARQVRPVVDEATGRLYAFTPGGDVVLLKEYEEFRRRCARDAAMTFWGHPSGWDVIDERIVGCECPGCGQPRRDWSCAWRVTGVADGVIRARIICVSDHGTEVLGEEHILYTSPHLLTGDDARSVEIDTFCAMVERFGEPYDMATGEVAPSYRLLYERS